MFHREHGRDTARSIVEVGFANVRDLPHIAEDVFAPSLLASGTGRA
jgi:hypothetical protein